MPERLLKIPAILERGVSDVASVFDAFGVGIYCVDLGGRFTYVNPSGQELLGWDAGELLGRDVHETIHHSHPDGSRFALEACPLYRALQRGTAGQELDDVFWLRDGSPLEVAQTIAPLYEDEKRVGAIVVFIDVRQRRRDTELLRSRAAQQSALAELGLLALGGGPLKGLLEKATVLVAQTLDVDLAQAFELDPAAGCLRLRAGVGLRAGLVGTATVETGRGSLAGYTVARDQPVVVEDLRAERRFRAPSLLLEHGVVSGLTVVIHGGDRRRGTEPWGVLGAHTRSPRTFTEEDINFLHTVANTLGLAVERNDAEQELRQRNREIAELAEQVSKLADDRRRIMADALDAEDRTRERISQLLHDEVLQSLLAARQDLAKLKPSGKDRSDPAAQAREAIVGAIGELRNAVVALHPVTLEQGGLASALQAIADLHARRGGFEASLNVRPRTVGLRDQLIVSLAQELLSNVAQHAQASHVTITLCRTEEGIVLEVADDGHGMDATRPRQALDEGHVGLASVAMRVESLGGTFQITTNPGRGTRVRTMIPVEAPGVRAGRALSAR
ncbi:MAG TPA: PAS domain-containing protein [Solirubrobacteraceae bacterium]|nr:PAS domain-containing protein [Solirubrobacteraceae bacterium]